MPQTFAIIAGGGTAGHVVPGLAIASALTERGLDSSQIHYVGSARGIENRLVPAAGFPLTVLPGRGIQRRLTSANVRAAIGLVAAIVRGIVLVGRLRPAVVVALGGYASVPCVIGAVLWRVPIVVAEQNAVPGAANRLASRFARACAVSFADVDLPRATWTGNPVRPEVLAVANTTDAQMRAARNRIGIGEDRVLVAVFGGSLGARRINNAIADAVPGWHQRADLAVRHVTGARDHEEIRDRMATIDLGSLQYQLVEYEDDMPTVYAAADVVLCRAGASSVAELAVVGAASVLVPLPGAPGDHQTANAHALVSAGAAILVPDHELDADRLRAELDPLIGDAERRRAMQQAALRLARPDAAASVVDLVTTHARRPLAEEIHR